MLTSGATFDLALVDLHMPGELPLNLNLPLSPTIFPTTSPSISSPPLGWLAAVMNGFECVRRFRAWEAAGGDATSQQATASSQPLAPGSSGKDSGQGSGHEGSTERRRLRVIALSGEERAGLDGECTEAGFDELFAKPLWEDKLREVLTAVAVPSPP